MSVLQDARGRISINEHHRSSEAPGFMKYLYVIPRVSCQSEITMCTMSECQCLPCVMSDHACYLGPVTIWCQSDYCCHPAPPGCCCCLVTGSLSNNTMQWTLIKCLLSNMNLMRKYDLNLLFNIWHPLPANKMYIMSDVLCLSRTF